MDKPFRKGRTKAGTLRYGPYRDLTPKQQLFVKNFTNSKNKKTWLNQRQSMIALGNAPSAAGVTGWTMMKKPHVKAAILEALHKVKITPEYQAKKLKELLESNISIYHNGIKIDDVPDNKTRHQALVTSLKITDAIDGLEDAAQGGIHISEEALQRLTVIAQEMRMMREKHSGQVMPIIKPKEEDDGRSSDQS